MKSKAFTLIELLVVISIIGVLASVVLVSFSGSRDKAKLAKAQNFDAQISHSLGAYAIGIWRFEEGSGTTAYDESGYGNDINLNGSWVDGMYNGKAYKFNNSNTDFGKGIGLGVTYSFWFKLPDLSDTAGTFFCVEDAVNTFLEDNLGQKPYGDNTCATDFQNSEFNISDTDWHHYVFSKSSDSQLCLDGKCKSV